MQRLRDLMKFRYDAVRNATRCFNKILNTMTSYGYAVSLTGGVRLPQGRSIVEDILEGRLGGFPELCHKKLPLPVVAIVQQLYTDADMYTKRAIDLTCEVKQIIKVETFVVAEKEINGAELLKLLKTVPGVGDMTAITWLTQIVDPTRFKSPKAIAAYCGCDPTLKVSAGKVTSYTRRGGNKILKKLLLQAAGTVLTRASEPFGIWASRIAGRHKKGGHRKATGALARRIAVALYHVHGKMEVFSYEKYKVGTLQEVDVVLLGKTAMPSRFVSLLSKLGISDTGELRMRYLSGLSKERGVGSRCMEEVEKCLNNYLIPTKRHPSKEPVFTYSEKSGQGHENK
jgi:hypothetical protein